MLKSKVRVLAAALAVMGVFGALANPAYAKRAKCVETPVPGQPGTFIVTCTTVRP